MKKLKMESWPVLEPKFQAHIVIVEASMTGSGLKFIDTALANNLSVTFFTRDLQLYKDCYGEDCSLFQLEPSRLCVFNTTSVAEIVSHVEKIQATQKVDGLFTASEFFIEVATQAAVQLGLPHQSLEALGVARNKEKTRELLRKHDIPTPLSYQVQSQSEAVTAAQKLGFPVILKPSRGAGSADVLLCQSLEDVGRQFEVIKANLKDQGCVLVEEFVQGPLVSVESLTWNNEIHFFGLSSRTFTPHPNFCEMSYSFPYLENTEIAKQAQDIAKRALLAVGHKIGAAHTEIIISKRGPLIIELNLRVGGFFVGEMISEVYGFDYFYELLRLAIHEKPQIPPVRKPQQGAASLSIVSSQTGVYQGLGGLNLSSTVPGLKRIQSFKKIGSSVRPPEFVNDIVGGLWATGISAEHALSNCHAAEASLRVIVRGEESDERC